MSFHMCYACLLMVGTSLRSTPLVVNNHKTFVEMRIWQLVDLDQAVDGRKAR